jgi:UDP-3-O-[3-hydroxymyristoyl] glucosamine N-acyltransferase
MEIKLGQILSFLDKNNLKYTYTGSSDLSIEGFCALSEPKQKCITWIKKIDAYDFSNIEVDFKMLFVTNISCKDKSVEEYNIIKCDNPKEVFFEILNHFFVIQKNAKIEPDSVIETDHIGINVSIGHHCFIGKDVLIGNNVTMHNNIIIECPTEIGDNTIIWSGVIIGTDGYGYFKKSDGINYKVPHFGGVKIGKNVEIGANTCIDRGCLADTVIGNNVKIDDLCLIAHNVHIEDNVMITAMSMLAGSSRVSENTWIAPGVLVLNQKVIEKNVFVGIGSFVINNIPENKAVFGVPAMMYKR